MADQSYLLGAKALRRVAATVKRVESQIYTDTETRNRAVTWNPGVLSAVVTTPIGPFNSNTNTFGFGKAQPVIDEFNTNSNSYICVNDNSYATNGSTSVVVLNNYANTNTVNSGTRITIGWRNGNFLFLGGDC